MELTKYREVFCGLSNMCIFAELLLVVAAPVLRCSETMTLAHALIPRAHSPSSFRRIVVSILDTMIFAPDSHFLAFAIRSGKGRQCSVKKENEGLDSFFNNRHVQQEFQLVLQGGQLHYIRRRS